MFVTHFQSGFNVVALVAMAAGVAPIVLGFLLMVAVLGYLHRRPLSLPSLQVGIVEKAMHQRP